MIVLIDLSNTHSKYKYNKYMPIYYSLAISTLNKLILLTYILHHFDHASYDDKLSRISHNLITLCYRLQVMFS